MTLKGQKSWNSGTSKGWLDKRGYRWIYVVENGRKRANCQANTQPFADNNEEMV